MKFSIILTIILGMLMSASFSSANQKPSLCILGRFAPWLSNRIDKTYKQKLNELDYQIGSMDYSEVTAESLKPFDAVLMEWVPSPRNAEGYEIFQSALPVLNDFVQKGGAFSLHAKSHTTASKRSINF